MVEDLLEERRVPIESEERNQSPATLDLSSDDSKISRSQRIRAKRDETHSAAMQMSLPGERIAMVSKIFAWTISEGKPSDNGRNNSLVQRTCP